MLKNSSIKEMFNNCSKNTHKVVVTPLKISRTWTKMFRLAPSPKICLEELLEVSKGVRSRIINIKILCLCEHLLTIQGTLAVLFNKFFICRI